jgi:hypothetical protein
MRIEEERIGGMSVQLYGWVNGPLREYGRDVRSGSYDA